MQNFTKLSAAPQRFMSYRGHWSQRNKKIELKTILSSLGLSRTVKTLKTRFLFILSSLHMGQAA